VATHNLKSKSTLRRHLATPPKTLIEALKRPAHMHRPGMLSWDAGGTQRAKSSACVCDCVRARECHCCASVYVLCMHARAYVVPVCVCLCGMWCVVCVECVHAYACVCLYMPVCVGVHALCIHLLRYCVVHIHVRRQACARHPPCHWALQLASC